MTAPEKEKKGIVRDEIKEYELDIDRMINEGFAGGRIIDIKRKRPKENAAGAEES
ncbi:hypothetical protein [Sinobaca sp. H24]|uniref:hypothetical protein n=1 Tax=Sinobaca sp. H24 TaxID=2923376 RepID=UPI00207AFFDE|nr:hypothetical protein [Sinobaca sp. H24]